MSIPAFTEYQPDALIYDSGGIRTARNFSVIASSGLQALQVLRTNGVYRGRRFVTPYGETPDLSVICTAIDIMPDEGACIGGDGHYRCKAHYARRADEAQPGEAPIWRVRGSLVTQVVDHDIFGQPICNSADEPVQLQKLTPTELLYGEWWIQTSNLFTLQASLRPYRGAVNNAVFFGAPIGCFMCHGVEVQDQVDDWAKLNATFEYRPPETSASLKVTVKRRNNANVLVNQSTVPGWVGRYADLGRREKVDGEYPAIQQADGAQVIDPVPLDGEGLRVDNDGQPALITVELYTTLLDFNDIPGVRGD